MITKLIKFLAIFFVTLSQNLENFNKDEHNTSNDKSNKESNIPDDSLKQNFIQESERKLNQNHEEIIYDGSQIIQPENDYNNKGEDNMDISQNINPTETINQRTSIQPIIQSQQETLQNQEIIPEPTLNKPVLDFNNDVKEKQPILKKSNEPTLLEVEQLWEESHFKQVTKSTASSYQAAFKYLEPYYDWPFTDLKYKEWQGIVNQLKDEGKRFGSQKKMKCLCGQLCSFAIKNEIATTNYGPMLELDKNVPLKIKVPFSIEEIQCLWQHKYWQYVDIVLLLIYTGVRAGEFLRIDVHNDVFLDEPGREYFIVRQSKTQAGTNRPVPIHKDILPIFQKYVETKSTYMFSENGEPLSYAKLRQRFEQVMRVLNMNHTPHECRHTLATLLDNFGANDLATKKILGHAARGVTKSVYSHKTIDDLFKAINTIQIRKPRPTKQAMPSLIDNSKSEKKENIKWV